LDEHWQRRHINGDLVLLQFVKVAGQCVATIGPLVLPQPRQEIAAITDQRRETPSFIDRLCSEASVTIFPVALSLRGSTACRAAMHSATGFTGDRW
jgi:hypothetical protein